MQNPYRKPIALTKRISLYAVIIIALLIGGIFGTTWVLGYRFDPFEQTVERIGLMQLGSTPSNAVITVDSELLNFNTPGRFETSVGEKKLAYYLEGYHSWQKQIDLSAAQLRWLNYARLLPTVVESKTIKSFTKADAMLTSPDHSHALILQDSTQNLFTNVNLSRTSQPELTDIAIPAEALVYRSFPALIDPLTAQTFRPLDQTRADPAVTPTKYALVEYEAGSVYALVQVTYSNGDNQFIVLNTNNPSSSINLSQKISLQISSPHFIGKSGTGFFAVSAGQLIEINLYRSSVSEPLAKNVTSYSIYGEDKLLYIRKLISATTGQVIQQVGMWDNYRNRNSILSTFGSNDLVLCAWTHYYDEDYVAIYRNGKLKLIVNPILETNTKPVITNLDIASLGEGAPDWLQFNGTGRFLVVGSGSNLYTHDLEYGDNSRFSLADYQPSALTQQIYAKLSTSINPAASSAALSWLDDFYLQYQTVDGALTWIEFDGQNLRKITAGQAPGLISTDDEWLYYLAKTDAGFELRSCNLVII